MSDLIRGQRIHVKPIDDMVEKETLDDIAEAQEQLMQDVRYDAFKQEYYGAFVNQETTNLDCAIQRLNKPFVGQGIHANPYDKLQPSDGFGGDVYIGDYAHPSERDELKEMINKQFGKGGDVE